jgi:predicted Zn-dependent protease
LWSDATFAQTQDTRLGIVNRVIDGVETAGMMCAGYLSAEARAHVVQLPEGRLLYARQTIAQLSLTVRDPEGTGSGWAGLSSYDWGKIDADKLAAIALDKCLKSRNPVRIEPGRYTLIMEPQATFGLVEQFWRNVGRMPYWSLLQETLMGGPFHAEKKTTVTISQYADPLVLKSNKIGERIMDPRINIRFDPWDPDLGCVPFDGEYPIQPVQEVTNGVLTALDYGPGEVGLDAIVYGSRPDPRGKWSPGAFRIDSSAPPTSMDEMIATTARGLLATRFWGVTLLNGASVLCTGTTRDGLWLIERGKITHAVRNLRFTESPLFVLNQVEQIGAAVPIFSPENPAVVPPMKVRDFSFTALEDAV